MITDRYIYKEGKQIEKVSLMYIDGDKKLCDGCDEHKICATITGINTPHRTQMMILCKDCLQEMVDEFNRE